MERGRAVGLASSHLLEQLVAAAGEGAVLVPAALLRHPGAQRGVGGVLLRHIAVAVLVAEPRQLLETGPSSRGQPSG